MFRCSDVNLLFFEEFTLNRRLYFSTEGMTTRSQKSKAVAELVCGELEARKIVENNQHENLIAGPSNSPNVQPENIKEIKTSLRKEIISDLAKLLAENQMKIMKLVAPPAKNSSAHLNGQDSDSETENISVACTSKPVKTNTAAPKTTPINSRNRSKSVGFNISQKCFKKRWWGDQKRTMDRSDILWNVHCCSQ